MYKTTMVRVLFIFALLVAAASAFMAPAQHSVTTPAFARKSTTSVQMIPVEATEVISSVAQNAQLIATNADEFGGYFYPVAGIALLATLILYLSPPLADN